MIIFKLFIYDYAIKLRILDGFLKLNSNNHPTVTTLRPGAADGIGTVMQAFESRPTRAASGRLRGASGRCPDGSGRRPDGSGRLRAASGRLRTVPDGSGRLLVGPSLYDQDCSWVSVFSDVGHDVAEL